jgi:prepilin-type N-terminal cleavage/methylation domain-containing protein
MAPLPTSTATRTREGHAARGGFTLLEVVVALAVTATVLVVLQRAVGDALRARGLLAAETARRGALRAAVLGLANDLGAALPGSLRIERGTPGAPPVLEFAVDEPAPEILRYRVVAETLERTAVPRFALVPRAPAAVALLSGVRTLDVRGYDDEAWRETWDAPALPVLVAFDLALTTGEHAGTTVPLLPGGRS